MDRFIPILQRIWAHLPFAMQERILLVTQSTFTAGVSGLVLNDRGEILLLRNRFRDSALWLPPGGFVRAGEDLQEAFLRELREETGLEAEIVGLHSARPLRRRHIDIAFLCRITGGTLMLDTREVLEARFFAADDLPSGMSEADKASIQRAPAMLGHAATPRRTSTPEG